MEKIGPEDRNRDPSPESSSGGGVRRPILAPLGELMADLAGARRRPMAPDRNGEPPTHWADGDNLYMSFTLEGAGDLDVDISICYGKVYIRVTR